MITAERKPIDEIRAMIAPYKRVLVLGCGSCVAECAAGGEKETGHAGLDAPDGKQNGRQGGHHP